MKKILYFLSLALTFIIVLAGIIAFLFFREDLTQKFFTKQQANQPGAIAPNEQIVTCKPGDSACTAKNERIKANKLPGQSAAFARHQCDGPRSCPTPKPEEDDAAQAAIKAFAKDTKMELIRITGVNAQSDIYYCSEDSTCWSYNTKSKKVTELKNTEEPSQSPTEDK